MGELQIGVALFTTHGRVESDKYPAQKVYVGMKRPFVICRNMVRKGEFGYC